MERWHPDKSTGGLVEGQKEQDQTEPMDCSYVTSGESAIWGRLVVKAWIGYQTVQAILDFRCTQSLVRAGLMTIEGYASGSWNTKDDC